MSMSELDALLFRAAGSPSAEDLEALLSLEEPGDLSALFERAHSVRTAALGEKVILRGIVEFSSVCRHECLYCGIRAGNPGAVRYRLNEEQILRAAAAIARRGIGTVVLQGGEDPGMPPERMAAIIRMIKQRHPLAVTLAAGEAGGRAYRLWREAGADRYLLKIETTDPILYRSLHPGMDLQGRLDCIKRLKALGYETGTGLLLGLPGQTTASLARDLLYLRDGAFAMIGSGPFIPHPETPLGGAPAGDPGLALKVLAITRLLCPNAHLPVTTALQTADAPSGTAALRSGADVMMLNFTPRPYRDHYAIYPSTARRIHPPAGAHSFQLPCAGGTYA